MRTIGQTFGLIVLSASLLFGQSDNISQEQVRQLQEQIRQLQARIEMLESNAGSKAASFEESPPVTPQDNAQVPAQVATPAGPTDDAYSGETGDFSPFSEGPAGPRMRLLGFGNVDFRFRNSGSASSFELGQLDLFLTSTFSNHMSALVESVFEYEEDTQEGILDVERVLLQYKPSPYLHVDLGRYHSGIGYYNTEYHHGVIFQTALDRPAFFSFEDDGGILPIHNIGVSANGEIPSGSLGLHYLAEMGNGRSYGSPSVSPVQPIRDENGTKSVNVGFWMQPSRLTGLRLGASVYRDRWSYQNDSVRQFVFAGYAVYRLGRIEFLNESLWMHHSRASEQGRNRSTSVPGGYALFSYRLGSLRPYFRYEFLNPNESDPVALTVLGQGGWQRRMSMGIRYDLNEGTTVKFQMDRLAQKNLALSHQARMQFAFAF